MTFSSGRTPGWRRSGTGASARLQGVGRIRELPGAPDRIRRESSWSRSGAAPGHPGPRAIPVAGSARFSPSKVCRLSPLDAREPSLRDPARELARPAESIGDSNISRIATAETGHLLADRSPLNFPSGRVPPASWTSDSRCRRLLREGDLLGGAAGGTPSPNSPCSAGRNTKGEAGHGQVGIHPASGKGDVGDRVVELLHRRELALHAAGAVGQDGDRVETRATASPPRRASPCPCSHRSLRRPPRRASRLVAPDAEGNREVPNVLRHPSLDGGRGVAGGGGPGHHPRTFAADVGCKAVAVVASVPYQRPMSPSSAATTPPPTCTLRSNRRRTARA